MRKLRSTGIKWPCSHWDVSTSCLSGTHAALWIQHTTVRPRPARDFSVGTGFLAHPPPIWPAHHIGQPTEIPYTVWDLNTPAHTPRPTQAGCPTSQLKAVSSRKPSHRFPCAMKDSIAPQALQILLPWPQSQPSFQVDLTVLGSHQPLPTGLWTPRPRS